MGSSVENREVIASGDRPSLTLWIGSGTKGQGVMNDKRNKRQLQAEIDRARRAFIASGRRVRHLAAGEEQGFRDVKPRKQRLKLLA